MTPAPLAPEPADETKPHAAPRRWRRTAASVAVVSWLYALSLLSLWLLLRFGADRWWVATVAMFTPRSVWSAPLLLLLPAALLLRRRSTLLPVAIASLVLLGPVMQLCVPWRRLVPGPSPSLPPFRVVTLNADQGDLDPEALRAWIEQTRPDVIALQAFSARQQYAIFGDSPRTAGWHLRKHGELMLASRHPITSSRVHDDRSFSGGDGGTLAAYDLRTPAGAVHVFNLHVATPRYALLAVLDQGPAGAGQVRANIDRRHKQSELARGWVDEASRDRGKVLVLGDFNMPPDSAIYRRQWANFSNAFSASGFGFGNTHFTRHTAVRIDHVLAGPGLRVRRAWVGPSLGSAHRPVVADLEPTPAP